MKKLDPVTMFNRILPHMNSSKVKVEQCFDGLLDHLPSGKREKLASTVEMVALCNESSFTDPKDYKVSLEASLSLLKMTALPGAGRNDASE